MTGSGPPGASWVRRLAVFLALALFLLFAFNLGVGWLLPAEAAPATRPPWWLPLPSLAAALLATLIAAERMEGLSLAAIGLPWPGAGRTGTGFLLGAALTGLPLALLAAAGWVRVVPAPGGAGDALRAVLGFSVFLAAAAWVEELLFRGYPFQVLAERFGGMAAVAVTSVAFGAVHFLNPEVGLLGLVNLVLAGVVLGLAYWRTYSLWFVTGLHFGWNWMMAVALDLPVSGLTLDVPAYEGILSGPELLTGGGFGPEGGLAVTGAAILGALWLARTRRLSRDLSVRAAGALPDRGIRGGGPDPSGAADDEGSLSGSG